MAYTRVTFSKKRTPKNRTPKRKSTPRNGNFNKRVQLVINRNLERKMKTLSVFDGFYIKGCGLTDTAVTGYNPGINVANLLQTMNLTQGSNQEQRIGNAIQSCRLRVRGFIESLPLKTADVSTPSQPANTDNRPFEVHMLIYKKKKDVNNSLANIKQLPANTTGTITNEIINSLYPFNRDTYVIKKHRVFKLKGAPAGDATSAYSPQDATNPGFCRFIQDIPISPKLLYTETTSGTATTVPTNDWVGICFYVMNSNGAQLTFTPTGGLLNYQAKAKITMDAVLSYTDA